MTTEEKAAAFDTLCLAMTNRWHDGSWSWHPFQSCGGLEKRLTRGEAIADLIEWSKKIAKHREKRCGPLSTEQPSSASALTDAPTPMTPSSTSAAPS